jgi:2-methylcitrate dehydratase PrpD
MASGSLEFLEDGAWTKRLHPGWAAVAGTTAATFAKHGYIGSRAAYEGRFGLFASHLGERMKDAEIGLATQGLMTQWEINEVAVKPLAACHFTHAPADAALALHAQFGLEPRDIARVVVLVPQQVVKVVCEPVANKKKPQNSYDAQFSIPYIVATCLVKGRFTLDELEDDALADDAVLALARRVDYEIDEASTFPRHYTGEVIIETTDGRRLRHREAINRGSADRPLSNAEIVAKFHGNAGRALTREAAQRVAGAILNLEQHGARQLGDVLAAPPAR